MIRHIYGFLVVMVIVSFFSCTATKNAVYFKDLAEMQIDSVMTQQLKIQKNDILSISVSSLNPEASTIFNLPNLPNAINVAVQGTMPQYGGYLVNEDGDIQFPTLGKIRAAGLSKDQLSLLISKRIVEKKLLLDPIINIRQLNFHVTVLGEVNHPTTIAVPNEKITLLEALGNAGDLTVYARRDNVLLIREENGKKITHRINLNSNDILYSPFYYLQTNDVIYVEPNKAKIHSTSDSRQVLPLILSGLSILTVVATRYIK